MNGQGFLLKAKTGENVASRRILHFDMIALLAVMNAAVTDTTVPVFWRDPHGAGLVRDTVMTSGITNTRAAITTGAAMAGPTFYNRHDNVF